MYVPFTTTVLLLVFTSAFSAPTTTVWNTVKESSIKLNTIAKKVASDLIHQERNIHVLHKYSPDVVQARDKCDPTNLRSDSKPCIEKIAALLKNYYDIFEMLGQFSNCKVANNAKEIVEELGKFHYRLKGSEIDKVSKIDKELNMKNWEKLDQCLYSVERLYSFSILTARVFALGDPAQHIQDSTVDCRSAN